ncbi:armadillo-type protein [Mortierella sp. GBAus27b]|nr:armadillo-type protein [Mortierella sp. GBAus27b]
MTFEKATGEPIFGCVYAKLCHKLHEKVSEDVKDASIPGLVGGKLFRKCLLHRCQEDDLIKGRKNKTRIGGVSLIDKNSRPDVMSDEYHIVTKVKRQGLGLIHFLGELFKVQMLTEKIMHKCVKKLLANVKDPEEEEIEGLCVLMTTIGLQLDHEKARSHMDVYFSRMVELTKNTKLPNRIRFMVQGVIDLRANKWVNRRATSRPMTIAAIHEEAAREQEWEITRSAASSGGRSLPNRREQLGRGPSFRGSGDARHDVGVPAGAAGWPTVPHNAPKKAGDLSSFGNMSRSKTIGTPSLGPSQSVFGSLVKSKPEKSRPMTIAAIHEEAAREQEWEITRSVASSGGRSLPNRREQLGRGPSFRGSGDARHDVGVLAGADGWSTVPHNAPKKAGDLSSFGNMSRSKTIGTPSLGPSQSVFGSLAKSKREKSSTQPEPTRQTISANSFAALEGDASDRRSSVDADKPTERKPLKLQPRSIPIADQEGSGNAPTKNGDSAPAGPKNTEEEAKRSIQTKFKEYMSLKDMNEMLASVKDLDACYRPLLVTELVNQSMDMKQSDVDSIADIFKKLLSEQVVTGEDFEAGFVDPLEFLPDTAIDCPNARKFTAQLLEAAGMDPFRAEVP